MPDFMTRGVKLRLADMGFKQEYLEHHQEVERKVLPEVRNKYRCPYER